MRRTWLIILSALFIAACSDSNGGGGTGGAGGTGGTGGGTSNLTYPLLDCDPLVREFCGYPFPSNVYSVEDSNTPTGRRVSFDSVLLLGNDPAPWNKSDGFSAGSPILTFFPGMALGQFAGPDDLEDEPWLAEDSPSIVLDAETGEIVPHFAEIDIRASSAEQRSTMIRPVVRLRDNTRYIVAFRNLMNEDGETIQPSPVFEALRDGTSSDEPSVEARRDLYEDIFAKLEAKGWNRSDVQIAWDFNTASDTNNTQWLLHMRDTAFQIIEDDGGFEYTYDCMSDQCSVETSDDPGAIDPTNIAFRIKGTFRAPNFMTSVETSVDEPSLLVFGEDGPAVNQETPWMDVPFEVLIPQSATSQDPAAIIEYGHGLLGSFSGEGESGHLRSFMNEYNYAFCGTDLIGMSSSDYDPIVGALFVGDISGLQTMFDRLHQGFLNYVLLLRMMKTSFANDPTYGQYIKGDEAYYYGISQGGIMGSVLMATSPDIERGALGVMGQPYSFLLFRSTDFTQFLNIIKANYNDFRAQQFLVALFQMLWDRVEPDGYTHHIHEDPLPGTNPKDVLMRAAIGDHQVTTYGAHIMARTLNAPHLTTGLRSVWGLTPVQSTESGSFFTEYDFGLPGQPPCDLPQWHCHDPHGELRKREAARKQLDAFLRSGVGTNFCMPGDGDEYQATAQGVCSYPDLAQCPVGEETDEATQALCVPGAAPPSD